MIELKTTKKILANAHSMEAYREKKAWLGMVRELYPLFYKEEGGIFKFPLIDDEITGDVYGILIGGTRDRNPEIAVMVVIALVCNNPRVLGEIKIPYDWLIPMTQADTPFKDLGNMTPIYIRRKDGVCQWIIKEYAEY